MGAARPLYGPKKSLQCSTTAAVVASSWARCEQRGIVSRREPGMASCDASDGAGSPWLVLVREPDQLGLERTHPQLAFGLRLVELAEPNRHVAA